MVQTKSSNTLLSIPEVSEMLGISRALCRGLIKAGTITSIMVGKRHKVRQSDLQAYIENNKYKPVRVFQAKTRNRRTS